MKRMLSLVLVVIVEQVAALTAKRSAPALSVKTMVGVISGTPTQTGTYGVTISATNSEGTTGSATVVVTIT